MLYLITLFLHVIGALMLSAAIGIEWLFIINFRKSRKTARIQENLSNYSGLSRLGGGAMFLILISGIYMTVVSWHGLGSEWAIAGFVGFSLIGIIHRITTNRKISRVLKAIKTDGYLSEEVESLLSRNSLLFSIRVRTSILIGIIFLMTVRPGLLGSICTLALVMIIGLIPFGMKKQLKAT